MSPAVKEALREARRRMAWLFIRGATREQLTAMRDAIDKRLGELK